MCDYCGCRTHPSIERFAEEHDQILTVVRELELAYHADDRAGQSRVARGLLQLLAPHVAREEGTLFVELSGAGAASHVTRLESEHRHLEQALAPIADATATSAERAALPAVLAELRRHIWVEEHDVFPAAWQVLDADAWDRIASADLLSPPLTGAVHTTGIGHGP